MRKIHWLALTAFLLLGITSCAPQGVQENNANKTAPSATPAATTSPTVTPQATPQAPAPATVKGSNFKWQDDASGTPVTTIKVGGSITWTITGGTHSLEAVAPTAANGCDEMEPSFDSDTMESGDSVTRTFNKVGTFGYKCGIHGGTPNCTTTPGSGRMPGVIKVVP